MKLYIAFALMILSGIALTIIPGCSKDNSNAQFWLHLHTNIDTAENTLGQVYANPTDSAHTKFRNMTIDSGGYTVSNIQMIDSATGKAISISGSVNAIADSEQYKVSTINPGKYKSITFSVSNWRIYGKVDTSAAGTGTDVSKFVKYYFVDSSTVTVTMPDHAKYFAGNALNGKEYTVTSNQQFFVHMIADYSVLLRGIDMRTIQSNAAWPAVSSQMSTNIPKTFHYEE